jgi:Ca-activated chloride channel family protein
VRLDLIAGHSLSEDPIMISNEYGVITPVNSIFALLLLVAIVFEARGAKLRAAAAKIFGVTLAGSRLARTIVTMACGTLLVFALVRPFWGYEDIKTESHGSDVIFLVDISRSMYAQDLPPSRIEITKRKIKDLIQALTENGTAARFGITVFAGDGYTVCPVTTDRGVLKQFIEVISPDLVSSLGSNLKAGINAALGRVDEATAKSSRIILFSDGEDNFLNETPLVNEIKTKGVRLDVLGVGTLEGSSIMLPNGSSVVDSSRRPVTSVLNEAPLQALASAGGGVYTRATLDDSDVAKLARPGGSLNLSASKNQSEIRSYREFGPWLALAALALISLSALNKRANPFLVLLLAPSLYLFSVRNAHATPTPDPNRNGIAFFQSPFSSYQSGDYAKAIEEYSTALKKAPGDRSLMFGLASSLYKSGKLQESEQIFKKLADSAQSGRDFFESRYNHGNSLLGLKRYQDAMDAYWSALDVKPDDAAARHNLSIARALLEAQQRATPTPTPTPSQKPSPDATPSPNPENSPTPNQDQSDEKREGSPSPNPEQSNSPNPSPEAQSSPTAAASSSPSDPSSTPQSSQERSTTPGSTPTASEQESPVPQPQDTPEERLKESVDPSSQELDNPNATSLPETNQAVPEAQAWLESLPDSPLLIRRHHGVPNQGNQTW